MHFKWFAITAFVSLIIGALFAEPFFLFLRGLMPKGIEFIAYNPFDGFMLLMYLGLAISVLLFSVFCLVVFWFEFKDAFYKKEKDFLYSILVPVVVLFLFGFVFGLFVYVNLMLPFFIKTNVGLGLANFWNLKDTIVSCVGLALMLGLCFQMPLVVRGLVKFGFVEKEVFKSKRKFVLLGVLVLAAVVTPSPDVLSQLLVGVPLYGLFEVGLL